VTFRVGVFGAGAVGTLLGVRLSSIGVPVVLLGRKPLLEARAQLHATDAGGRRWFPARDLVATDDPAALHDVDLCLVTVKSRDTDESGRHLAGALRAEVPVVSLQNGLHNADRLQHNLANVVAGVVAFNAFVQAPGWVHCAVRGPVWLGSDSRPATRERLLELASALRKAGIHSYLRDDIESVMAGKLLVNLANGVCGSTGLHIDEMLAHSDARWCYAQCIREGYRMLVRSGMRPARVTAVSPRLLPWMLAMPTWMVRIGARTMARMDPKALPSTLQDLLRFRPTEIDDLNGEIVRLAATAGMPAPCNAAIVAAVREHEYAVGRGTTPQWRSPSRLRDEFDLGLARRALPSI